MSPDAIFRKLKQQPGYFNYQRQTLAGLMAGKDQPLKDRAKWADMRMDPTDIADDGLDLHVSRERPRAA